MVLSCVIHLLTAMLASLLLSSSSHAVTPVLLLLLFLLSTPCITETTKLMDIERGATLAGTNDERGATRGAEAMHGNGGLHLDGTRRRERE